VALFADKFFADLSDATARRSVNQNMMFAEKALSVADHEARLGC